MRNTIFTIGHSTHSQEQFIQLLKMHNITAICDVRSKPYSRMNPQFNREFLKKALKAEGITYVFLGKELGARSDDPCCYEKGKVVYDRLSQTSIFNLGLKRILEGLEEYNIALMCAEKEPLDCHRTILVARHLQKHSIEITHIHANGSLETQEHALLRLLRKLNVKEQDMFRSQDDVFKEAYDKQGERIAYSEILEKSIDETILVDAS